MDVTLVVSFIMMLFSAYIITGFLICSVQELKGCKWRSKKRRRPALPLFSRKRIREKPFIVTLSDGSVCIMNFSFETYTFERDSEVTAWRPVPLPYRSFVFKGRFFKRKKGE